MDGFKHSICVACMLCSISFACNDKCFAKHPRVVKALFVDLGMEGVVFNK